MDEGNRQSVTAAGEMTRDELLEVLVRYNEATERLRLSHDVLRREVARLTAELEQKNRELERRQRLAMLGEMAAGVAHEIRNPLGGISLYADVLAEDLADRPEQVAVVLRMQRGIRVLNRIVEDMLLFARDLRIDARPHVLVDLVRAAVDLLGHETGRSGLRVVADESRLEAPVVVDGNLITRSLLNLILNSAQAAEGRAAASLRITAEWAVGQPTVAVILEDTCGGIAEEDLPRIFVPFFTRRDQGTGLGLAIVHRAIEAHGGAIAAWNNDVGGATFRFTLPAAECSGDSSPLVARADSSAALAAAKE
jgi:signal transduction histidine kinase